MSPQAEYEDRRRTELERKVREEAVDVWHVAGLADADPRDVVVEFVKRTGAHHVHVEVPARLGPDGEVESPGRSLSYGCTLSRGPDVAHEVRRMLRGEGRPPAPQRVEVGHRYCYEWRGEEPLEVGDLVQTEGNWLDAHPVWEVTALESDYAGPVKQVTSVIRRAER